MNVISKTLMCASIALAAGSSFAMDAVKKDEPMANQAVMKKHMTMQECKDHMAMAKKDGMNRDDAMMHSDAMCANMMKKHGTGTGKHRSGADRTGMGAGTDRTGTGMGTDKSGTGMGTDKSGTGMGTNADRTGTDTDKQRSGTGSPSTMPK